MDTEQALILWRGAQHDSERMCAQLLLLAGYRELDPSHPLGGPDRTKDAVCQKGGERWVMAVYFTRNEVEYNDVEAKLKDDAKGIAKNGATGIVFFTNNKLTISERDTLSAIITGTGHKVDLYHRERVRLLLDDPRGYGTRFKFLHVPMSEAEQASFFEVYNQEVLTRIDNLQQAQKEHATRVMERFDGIEAMMRRLAEAPVNLGTVLPETGAATPAPAPPGDAGDEREVMKTAPPQAPAAANEEGSAQ